MPKMSDFINADWRFRFLDGRSRDVSLPDVGVVAAYTAGETHLRPPLPPQNTHLANPACMLCRGFRKESPTNIYGKKLQSPNQYVALPERLRG